MVQSEIPQEKKDGSIMYQKTATKYDNMGNVTEKSEQMDGDRTAKTEYTYDKRGNLVMVKNCLEENKEPDGSSTEKEVHSLYVQYVYDIQGNKVRQFTGMTSPLTLTVTEVAEDTKEEDAFTYAGKTYRLTVSGKKKTDDIRETKYEYDGKNRLVAFTDPEGRRETYTYDRNSNLTKTVDKNGNTLKNEYDYQNRLTEMVAKEQKTGKEMKHSYTYNAYGDVATQDDTAFVYDDASGQVTKEITKLTKHKDVVKTYTYDSAGNKSAFAVKVGEATKLSLKYTYDGESRLTFVTGETGSGIAGYTYDTDGNLSRRTVAGNGMTTTYAYDYQNRLTVMKNQIGSAGVISEYNSEYLANGQKSKETSIVIDKKRKKTTKTATYTYDLLGRITKETRTGNEDISYIYDSSNNRKEMRGGNKVIAYKYNKNDELIRMDTLNTDTEKDKVVIYKNDRNGNQLATVNRYEIPSDKKDRPYIDIDVTLGDNRLNENVVNHYNVLNQLTKTLTKNYKVSFTYDVEGLRTSKTVNGEKTIFVWDGDQLVMELSESGKVKKRYIRGNDLIFADNGTENASGEASGKQYYVNDSHGNVVQLTDETGNVIKTYEYDSFGNEVKPDSKDDNPFRYCGEYYDKETEEIYLRARYYQPEKGRFLTRDTYTGEEDEPESLHLYAYCENDGVNMVDSTGHWSMKLHTQITKDVIKKLKKSKISLSKLQIEDIKIGCVLPDKVKNGYIVSPEIAETYEMFSREKGYHGMNKKKLNIIKKSTLCKINTLYMMGMQKECNREYVRLGATLHAIQDYCAHSFVSEADSYKKMYKKEKLKNKKVKISKMKRKYHSDYKIKQKNGKKYVGINMDVHSHYKDSKKWDFVNGNWKKSNYKNNSRIKKAKEDSVNFIKQYMKKPQFSMNLMNNLK